MPRTQEMVHFKLLKMPCCGQLLCWVNPRFPTHCPECGKVVYPGIKNNILQEDREAWLQINAPEPKPDLNQLAAKILGRLPK